MNLLISRNFIYVFKLRMASCRLFQIIDKSVESDYINASRVSYIARYCLCNGVYLLGYYVIKIRQI